MKTTIIFAIIASMLLLMTGCGSKAPADSDTTSTDGTTDSEKPDETSKTDSFTGSMKDLMARGVPMKCDWEVTAEGTKASGVSYVSGTKFKSEVNVQGMTSNTISDGTYLYSWVAGQTQGMKISMDMAESQGQEDTPIEGDEYSDLNAEYDFDCMPWVATPGTFTPPSSVTFKDYGELMKQMEKLSQQSQSGQAPSQQDMCAMCDMIPTDAEREDCLAQCGG